MEIVVDYSDPTIEWDEDRNAISRLAVEAEGLDLDIRTNRTVVINPNWSYSRYKEWIDTLSSSQAVLGVSLTLLT